MQISVILPAHNEESNIADMIQGLMQHYADKILEIIVVDDASTDETAQIVKDIICRNFRIPEVWFDYAISLFWYLGIKTRLCLGRN